MIVQKLELNGFRNLVDVKVSFSPRKCLIFGSNGSGKTSILEAIFILGFGKSFLGTRKSDLVNFNMDSFLLKMDVLKENISVEMSALFKNNSFHLYMNEKNTTLVELSDYFYPIFFSSSDYNRTIDSITEVRKVINRFIFGVQSLYIHYILSYNKILKQKNVLLKTTKNVRELNSWNHAISEMSSKIIQARIQFVDQLNQEIKNTYGDELRICYRPSFDTDQGTADEILFQELERKRHQEIKYQRSMIGPHLDGFEFRFKSKNLKFYSSGERKIHLLMIYMAFIEFFKRIKKQPPVFLIDDFDTAFDTNNLDFLLENCPDIQVIASSVRRFDGFDRLIELENGKVNHGE